MSNDTSTRKEEIAVVWSTTNSGEYHPVDGFMSMVNGGARACVTLCAHVSVTV